MLVKGKHDPVLVAAAWDVYPEYLTIVKSSKKQENMKKWQIFSQGSICNTPKHIDECNVLIQRGLQPSEAKHSEYDKILPPPSIVLWQ